MATLINRPTRKQLADFTELHFAEEEGKTVSVLKDVHKSSNDFSDKVCRSRGMSDIVEAKHTCWYICYIRFQSKHVSLDYIDIGRWRIDSFRFLLPRHFALCFILVVQAR